jgi:hypothetical protein
MHLLLFNGCATSLAITVLTKARKRIEHNRTAHAPNKGWELLESNGRVLNKPCKSLKTCCG